MTQCSVSDHLTPVQDLQHGGLFELENLQRAFESLETIFVDGPQLEKADSVRFYFLIQTLNQRMEIVRVKLAGEISQQLKMIDELTGRRQHS